MTEKVEEIDVRLHDQQRRPPAEIPHHGSQSSLQVRVAHARRGGVRAPRFQGRLDGCGVGLQVRVRVAHEIGLPAVEHQAELFVQKKNLVNAEAGGELLKSIGENEVDVIQVEKGGIPRGLDQAFPVDQEGGRLGGGPVRSS